jgi:predicted MFS family arabinose efflux permease
VPFAAIGLLTLGFFVLAVLRLPTLRTHLSAAEQSAWRQPFAKMTAVLKERNHRIAILFMALGGGSTFIVIPYIALYLSSTAGLDESQIPLVYAIGGIASFFSARRIGRLADEWGKVRSYRIVALLSIIPIFILTHLPVVALGWVLLVTTVFFGLGPGRAVSAMAITISAVKPPLRGTFMSLNAAIQQLACGVAAYLGSLLISQQDNGVMVGFGHAGWAAIAITGLTIYLSGQIQMHQIPTLAVSTQAASPDAELLVVKANQ